jgi:hypothetical protein
MAQSISITLDLGELKTTAATEIWKWGQVNKDDNNYQRIYHMQYGDNENVDRRLLGTYLRSRAERIADIVSEYLTDIVFGSGVEPIGINVPEPSPFLPPQRSTIADYVVFDLTLPGGWNPRTFQSLVKHFEDYAVNGAVADWFTNIGEKQGGVSEQKAATAAVDILKNIYHKN